MKHWLLGLLLLTGFQSTVLADDAELPDLAVRFPHAYVSYKLNDDATAVETRDWAMTILQQRAVEGGKTASVNYSTSIQHAEVLAAYTLKPDGRRIDAAKSNFQVEANSGKGKDAPVYSDRTTLTVVFPEVEVGDTVCFSYTITGDEAMFPKQFSDMEVFGHTVAYDDVRVRFDAPAALWAQYQANQMEQTRNEEKDGRRLLEWSYKNPHPALDKRTNFSVYDVESEPGVSYSTFKSYAEIAEAYGSRARAKAAPDARVRKLAGEIAGKHKEPREQARALYEWVAMHITYAGNCIGTGAVVPHDLGFILDNKMGDCKDHATLLQSLLAARGIPSTQALVNAGNGYKLPKIPVVSYVNHVISYIPSLNLYADSTSDGTPFGMLPFGDGDKPVLLVDGYRDDSRTPSLASGGNRQQMKSELTIHEDGSISGEMEVTLKGIYALATRANLRELPKDQERDLVENAFKRQGFIGKGTFDKDDPTALLDTYRYKVKFEMQSFTLLPGPAAFTIYPLFFSEAPVARFTRAAAAPDENVASACAGGASIEEYTYHLPAGMKVLAVPDAVDVSSDVSSYHAEYKLEGDRLAARRVLTDGTRGNVCQPAAFTAEKKFAAKVLQDLKTQIVYK